MLPEEQKPWRPLRLAEARAVFASAPFRWCIAGGYAIDLAIGRTTRAHADIDVLIAHRDHLALRRWLAHWDCWQADPPGHLVAWAPETELEHHVHDVWCRANPFDRWRLQVMLDNGSETDWISRRDPRVSAPWRSIIETTPDGLPFLAPHVQLFYKAKAPRPKDDLDLENLLSSGVAFDRAWLIDAIRRCYGRHHRWIEALE